MTFYKIKAINQELARFGSNTLIFYLVIATWFNSIEANNGCLMQHIYQGNVTKLSIGLYMCPIPWRGGGVLHQIKENSDTKCLQSVK